MKTTHNRILKTALAIALGATLSAALPANADSAFATGNAGLSAPANLDFKIVVPKFLSFRVGTNAAGTIDLITFTVPAANVGDGTVIAGTGGDATGGAVNVALKSNGGQVTLTESNNGGLNGLQNQSSATDFISYSEIQASSDNAGLAPPQLSNSSNNTSSPALLGAGSKVTNSTAVWTYTYKNTAGTIPAAGTYGESTNGGRVTYTASVL